MKLIIAILVMVVMDYFFLQYWNEFDSKYFIVLHGGLISFGLIIFGIVYFLQKNRPEFMGLGITAGLLIKMMGMLFIFILLYKKIELSSHQIINFLSIYTIYTIIYTISAVKRLNSKT